MASNHTGGERGGEEETHVRKLSSHPTNCSRLSKLTVPWVFMRREPTFHVPQVLQRFTAAC